MLTGYSFSVVERFMRYVQVDTQSNPASNSFPSTEKQKTLSLILVKEMKAMGMEDAHVDAFGYVYATIPANTKKVNVPVICFCSHVDTAPDCSGTNVKPLLHTDFDGSDIVLPDDTTQVLNVKEEPFLKAHIGHSVITASGLTLLGADDKSGVAAIMDMANFIITHPRIKHGTIKILFTPDEEIGKGTVNVDLKKLGADYAYTLDGGAAGTLEDETFSADAVTLTINGIIAHPGYAKNKMLNALKIAGEFLTSLPKQDLCPEVTEKREGFIHPVHIEGSAEKATIEFIIRDFVTEQLSIHEQKLRTIAQAVVNRYAGASMQFDVHEQYRNMKEILDQHPHVIEHAEEAYKRSGLTVVKEPIRGGTDGSRLSFMGLPCPNLFTGMQAIHSKKEWIGVKDMEKAVEVLVNLVQVWEENS